MEYKVAKQLQENQEELNQIYEGNPKRSSATPTARRLLKPFKGISLVVLGNENQSSVPEIKLTELKQVQLRILKLLGFQKSIYDELVVKMQLFFSNKKINKT